jgi:inward rectifier potassium channel
MIGGVMLHIGRPLMIRRRPSRPPRNPPSQRQAAGLRVGDTAGMELRKIGVSRFDLRDPYHIAVTLSWSQFFGLLLVVEMTTNLVFAILYALVPGSIVNARTGSLSDAFFFSVETLATVGYGVMAPGTLYGHVVSSLEILCGMTLTAVFTGLIFVRFSRPKAKILFADRPVVTRQDGKPVLMLRIGNGRLSLLGDARATMTGLVVERMAEGNDFRRAHDLKLVRAHFPIFHLTWTLVHEIVETSPLWGATPESLEASDFRMLVSVEARDHAIGNVVSDMDHYAAHDIAFGMRYVDAVSWDEHNSATADMTKISLIEPDSIPADGSERR